MVVGEGRVVAHLFAMAFCLFFVVDFFLPLLLLFYLLSLFVYLIGFLFVFCCRLFFAFAFIILFALAFCLLNTRGGRGLCAIVYLQLLFVCVCNKKFYILFALAFCLLRYLLSLFVCLIFNVLYHHPTLRSFF